MKKILFLLFVIGIMTIAPFCLIAQNVEEHQTITDVVRTGHFMRFTLEVNRDSALCGPTLQKTECYVISQKLKKYVFVDITETPNVTPFYARRSFEHPNKWMNIDTGFYAREYNFYPADFKKKDNWNFGNFPWMRIHGTKTDQFYYRLDNSNSGGLKMKKKSVTENYSENAGGVITGWIVILILLIVVLITVRYSDDVQDFESSWLEDNGWVILVSLLTFIMVMFIWILGKWQYALSYILCGLIFYNIHKIGDKFSLYKYDRNIRAYINPISFAAAILGFIFIGTDHLAYCYWILPIIIIIFLGIIFIPKIMDEVFSHVAQT